MKFKTGFMLLSMIFLSIVFSVVYCNAESINADKPERLILKLYEEHQPKIDKEISLNDEKTLAMYFTKELTVLFLRNEDCVKRTHEICNLDFDPIYYAQDYDNAPLNLKVMKISSKPQLRYQVMFTNIDRITLIYELLKTTSGWRINDIIYPSKHSLRDLLSQPQ